MRGGCSRQRLAQISHALPNRSDRVLQTMDLFGEGFERNDTVVAVRVKLAELLDVPEAILRPDEHAMPIQHVRETYLGVFQPGNVREPRALRENLPLSGAAMMKGVMHEGEDAGAADVVDRGKGLALETQRRDWETERLNESLEPVFLQ